MSDLPSDYKPPIDEKEFSTGPTEETLAATKAYGLSHTMFRIKDPKKSLDFYTRIIGMTLVRIMPMVSKYSHRLLLKQTILD